MTRALLIGKTPDRELGFSYCQEGEFDAVVIGSLTLGQLFLRVLRRIAMAAP